MTEDEDERRTGGLTPRRNVPRAAAGGLRDEALNLEISRGVLDEPPDLVRALFTVDVRQGYIYAKMSGGCPPDRERTPPSRTGTPCGGARPAHRTGWA